MCVKLFVRLFVCLCVCVFVLGMNRPSVNFIAQSFLPVSEYTFALTIRDYRVMFALNCASKSCLPSVPVYNSVQLHKQLDMITQLSLQQLMSINDNNQVVLPQCCQWFARDFDFDTAGNATGITTTNKQMLMILSTHVTGLLGKRLQEILNGNSNKSGNVNIKFVSLEFKCNLLQKLTLDI